jgi:hypothetical protein
MRWIMIIGVLIYTPLSIMVDKNKLHPLLFLILFMPFGVFVITELLMSMPKC